MATSRDPPGFTSKTGRLQLWTPLLRVLPDWGKPFYPAAKRVGDLSVSCLLLAFLSPLFLLIGLLVRMDSPGPIIFVQERMGYRWRSRQQQPFMCYKFRSMYHNSDQSVHEQHIISCIGGQQGDDVPDDAGILAKLAHDDRITPFGRVLRRTSLDELPQLWNVLRGDMSLVGPRPVPLYEVAQYNQWQRGRLEVTPGMTGLWQVQGRGRVTADGMAQMDIDYIARQSFWLDLEILVWTLPAVLRGRGAG
jgi:lipopolysaccharide/colanic/teichoic acid biosynthesis glycosyltransferase